MRSRLRLGLVAVLSFTLGFVSLPAATALDERVIDIATVTWSGARAPSVSATDISNSINTRVGPQWKAMTTFKGDAKDQSVKFVNGLTLATPVTLNSPIRCEGTGYSTFASAMRTEVYKRLGVSDYKDRYLIILTPFAGCVWEGRSSMGEFSGGGATITMQNSASAFVITH